MGDEKTPRKAAVKKAAKSGRNRSSRVVTRPDRIAAREKMAEALELRKLGMTFKQIAEEAGYNSPQAAHSAVTTAISELVREPAEDVIKIELERLDGLWLGSYPAAMSGDPTALMSCMRIMDRRARMLGLDAPSRVHSEVTAEITAAPTIIIQADEEPSGE